MPPRIVGNVALLQVGAVPSGFSPRTLHQRGKAFGGRRIVSEIEIEKIERTSEALDLDRRGLHLGLAEVIEHPRADKAHEQADDRDHDQDFDQSKTVFMPATGGAGNFSFTRTVFHASLRPPDTPRPHAANIHRDQSLFIRRLAWLT